MITDIVPIEQTSSEGVNIDREKYYHSIHFEAFYKLF
jgi:hypothetical protein